MILQQGVKDGKVRLEIALYHIQNVIWNSPWEDKISIRSIAECEAWLIKTRNDAIQALCELKEL